MWVGTLKASAVFLNVCTTVIGGCVFFKHKFDELSKTTSKAEVDIWFLQKAGTFFFSSLFSIIL